MDDLLELLICKVKCTYMSDLPRCRQKLAGVIHQIPDDRFPLSAWREAVVYIYRTNRRFESVSQVKQFIRTWQEAEKEI